MVQATIICLLVLAVKSLQIYDPKNLQWKPTTQSTGIKTFQVLHNYSKVYHHHPELSAATTPEQSQPITLYPVYVSNKSAQPEVTLLKKRRQTPLNEAHNECPKDTTGQFVYDLSCNQFLNCWKGRGHVQNCAPGTLFNPRTLECDFADKVECITGPRHNSQMLREARTTSGKLTQAGCPEGFSGIIPNYSDCSKFINCDRGLEHSMDCPPGTLFDYTRNLCDFERSVQCFNGPRDKSQGHTGGYRLNQGVYRTQYGTSDTADTFQSGSYEPGQSGSGCDPRRGCRRPQGQSGYGNVAISSQSPECDPQRGCQQGRDYQAVSSDTSYSTCDPLKGCRGGPQNTYSQSGYNNFGSTTIQNPNCDPQKGCGGGQQGPQPDYSQSAYNNFGSTNQNPVCDPRLGCRRGQPNYSQSGNNNFGNTNQNPECDPQQGCRGQQQGSQPTYSQSGYSNFGSTNQSPVCDPQQGCRRGQQNPQNSYGQSGHNTFGSTNQNPECDPQLGCRRGPQPGYSQSGYDNFASTNQNPECDPQQGCRSGQQPGYSQSGHNTFGSNNQDPECNPQQGCRKGQQFPQPNYNSQSGYNHGQGSQVAQPGNSQSGYNNFGSTSQNPRCDPQRGCQQGRDYSNYNSQPVASDTFATTCDPNKGCQGSHSQPGYYQTSYGHSQQSRSPPAGSSGSPKCSPGAAGVQQHPTDCSKFLNCANGFTYIQDCAPGTLFNPKIGNCDFPYNVDCDNNNNNNNPQEPNYEQVVNINQHYTETTTYSAPRRNSYEPFYGSTSPRTVREDPIGKNQDQQVEDFEDLDEGTVNKVIPKKWPPPFPSTDLNADYIFEYEDGSEPTLRAENSVIESFVKKDKGSCANGDFHCAPHHCIQRNLVCDGTSQCPNGKDELECGDRLNQFNRNRKHRLAVLEKERWDNVTVETCASLCLQSMASQKKFQCKSFNYRTIDHTCFLTNTNEALTGALISYYPCDYYERLSQQMDCTSKHKCPNNKCIDRSQRCDGHDDCGDRSDEKDCRPEDFGYSIKLTGADVPHRGRIEVTAFGRSGFICDDKFGLRDADVACRELGFSLGAAEVKGNSFFMRDESTDKPFYMMDDVTCGGNESRLMDCDFSGWGVHNCLGQEVVGVVCKTPQEKCPKDYWQCDTGNECLPLAFVCDGLLDCTDDSDETARHCDSAFELRLVNGTKRSEGRVEIKHHGTWGSVCDDDFNEDAAKVVCKSLGFAKGHVAVRKNGFFGPGQGPIWLDQVFCAGNESTIEECTHWNWGEHNCEHSEDVGVICDFKGDHQNLEYQERHSRTDSEYPLTCGLRKDNIFRIRDNVQFRVVSGSVAERGAYPWQAALRVKGKSKATHWCGAIVISTKFLLSAAHCLVGYSKGSYVVVAGDYNVDEDEGTEQSSHIEDFYIHEDFRKGHKMNNDIALIKLKEGFVFSDDIQPICLPDVGDSFEPGTNCTISGYGSIESGKSGFSHDLRAGWIPLQSREVCKMPHVYGEALTEGMICAGSLDEGVDSCDGDSGGPLACLNQGVFTLYGITSWGQHCGYANKPGVYVKVSNYRKWIDDTFHKHSSS